MDPSSTIRTYVSAADTASGRALGGCPQRNGTRSPRKYRSALIVRTGPTSRLPWPATDRHSPSMRATCTARTLSRQLASRLAQRIVSASGLGTKFFRRHTIAFPATQKSTWTTSTAKKRRAARVFYTYPPCRSTNSDFPKSATSPIQHSPKWPYMRYRLPLLPLAYSSPVLILS